VTRFVVALVVLGLGGNAAAQSRPVAPAGTAGTAGVTLHLQTLHYNDIQGLRRGPDGQWVGEARQGNVKKTVTIARDGTVTAR
jgi:hypothetical protein